MSGKPMLHYFNGRGRMETIRWLFAAANIEFDENLIENRAQYDTLLKSGDLMFQQVPMVEMDGMKLVQTKAITGYIAGKYNMYGKDIKERALIDMYAEGANDLMLLIIPSFFQPQDQREKQWDLVKERAKNRYFPVFEKALENQEFLVGEKLSLADVLLLEAILMVEELHSDILEHFPNLQAFKARTSSIPSIKKFLEPGSKRKPIPDEKYVNTVKEILFF